MNTLKTGGIMLTGLGAFLILSKAIGAAERAACKFADALAWRSYYKCNRKDPIPPHYSRTSSTTDDTEGLNDEVPNQPKEDNPDVERAGKAVGDAIVKSINNLFKTPEAEKEAVEGDLDASETSSEMAEEEDDISPTNDEEKEDDEK